MRALIPALTVVVVAARRRLRRQEEEHDAPRARAGSAVSGMTITIVEKDFSLTPSAVTITKPGTYTINGVNKGGTSHAIAITANGVEQIGPTVDPGGTSTVSADITKPGTYDIYCPVGNHKQLGMDGTVTLSAAGSASSASSDDGHEQRVRLDAAVSSESSRCDPGPGGRRIEARREPREGLPARTELPHERRAHGAGHHRGRDRRRSTRAASRDGIACVYSPHTTCCVRVNEFESGFLEDFANLLKRLVPSETYYAHDDWDRRTENICPEDMDFGNGHSHCMAMLLGTAGESIPVRDGELCLGTWQRVLFLELDRERDRRWLVQVVGN